MSHALLAPIVELATVEGISRHWSTVVAERTVLSKEWKGIAYGVEGTGEPVVLIHGVGLGKDVWSAQVADLAKDYQVIAYDTLGHGGSRVPPEEATLADYAHQLLELMDHLRLPAANVVGHSMGALVALEFAMTYPARALRVAALNGVFMRSRKESAAVVNRASNLKLSGVPRQFVDDAIARWFGDPVPHDLQSSARLVWDILASVDPVGYARAYHVFATSDSTNANRLPDLAIPALFMTGELDPNSTPAMSESMARCARDSQLEILKGAGHMMIMTHPQRVNESLRRLLAASIATSAVPAPGSRRQ